jgi:hypothetical protein
MKLSIKKHSEMLSAGTQGLFLETTLLLPGGSTSSSTDSSCCSSTSSALKASVLQSPAQEA